MLMIEILSPSNQSETWSSVWTYTSIPSVSDILVVQTSRVGAEVLRRAADGTWPAEPLDVSAGDLTLDSIGLQIPLAEIYSTTRFADTAHPE